MKQISRAAGRSATGAAAYRAGVEITDQRTGLIHDYTKKHGVTHSQIILPGGGTADRGSLWNAIEAHHRRSDAVLAREVEVSLPAELTLDARQALAISYAVELADRYGVAVDLALHAPSRHGDGRNWHAHILMSACAVSHDGSPGKKVIELDPIACQKSGPGRTATLQPADRERPRWQELVNQSLKQAGVASRVDHRSHEARGIEDAPTTHLGPVATQLERQGIRTRLGDNKRRRQAQTQRLRNERLQLVMLHKDLGSETLTPEPDSRQRPRRALALRARRQQEQRPRIVRDRESGPRGP